VQLRPPRPTSVTVLAILSFLAANLSFFLGAVSLLISILAFALFVLVGILDLVLAMGYLSGNGWAWTLGLALGIINIAVSIAEIAVGLSNPILGLILSIITVYYLTRPRVRVFFGKGFSRGSVTMPTSMGSEISKDSTPLMSSVARACKNCRAPIPAGASFCNNCGTIQ
jgi:hypothetical protein